MPAGLAEEFRRAAEAAADGLSMSLPSGSQVSFASEARGVNPFLEFVQHQQRQIVLLSTGGTLTSLAESGSGTLAGNAQMDVWREIVKRDAEIIGNALQRSIALPFLRRMFPGKPVAAEFSLGRDAEPTPGEMFDLAGKAVAAGYRISRDELSEATGYTLEDAPSAQPGTGEFGSFVLNTAPVSQPDPRNAVANPLQNSSSASDGENPIPDARTPLRGDYGHGRLSRGFAADMRPVARRLEEILKQPESQWPVLFQKLYREAPNLFGPGSALAAALALEMEAAAGLLNPEPARIANSGAQHCPNCGAFLNGDGTCSNPGCPDHGGADSEDDGSKAANPSKCGWSSEQVRAYQAQMSDHFDQLDNSYYNTTLVFGKVGGKLVEDVRAMDASIDLTGYKIEFTAHQTRHTRNTHGEGKETRADQIGLTKKDFLRVPDVIANYDAVEFATPNKGRKTIKFSKRYPDGTQNVVSADYSNRKMLSIRTIWKKRK